MLKLKSKKELLKSILCCFSGNKRNKKIEEVKYLKEK